MKTINVVGAAIIDPPFVLAFRRGPQLMFAGKWEFPGGKLEVGEDAQTALQRELNEELNFSMPATEQIGIGEAEVAPGIRVRLQVMLVPCPKIEAHYELTDHDQAQWLHANDLYTLDWAPADIPLLGKLKKILMTRPSLREGAPVSE